MAIEKVTRNYEVLIRINDDGKIGASIQTISGYQEDGAYIMPAQLDEVTQLTLDQLKAFVDPLTEADMYVPPVVEPDPVVE